MHSLKLKILNTVNRVKQTLSVFYLRKRQQNKSGSSTSDFKESSQELIEADKKLVFSLSKSRVPSLGQLKYLKRYLSRKELWIIRFCLLAIAASLAYSAATFYYSHLQVVPIAGGQYTEALISSPKNINPLYSSINDADHDINRLVFSSLFKRDKNGELAADLTDSYEVDGSNKTYSIKIRDDVFWHNDSRLTVDDIIFTFNAIKDPAYGSPLRSSFAGVQIEKIDRNSLQFILSDPYAAFLDLLTFGILPAEIWYQIPPESVSLSGLNLKPIGSGPYKFDKLIKDANSGNIKSYYLVKNESYYGQIPLIDIGFKFSAGFEEAIANLNSGSVDGISYLPPEYKPGLVTPKAYNFHKLNLPQLTAVFFNQSENEILAGKNIRRALHLAINRLAVVQEHLGGDAYVIDSPILPYSFAYSEDINHYQYNEREAEKLLDEAGWKLTEIENAATGTAATGSPEEAESGQKEESGQSRRVRVKDGRILSIKLTTINRPENALIVEAIKKYWERVGVAAEIELVQGSKIQNDIIKPRNFEAFFYGQVAGADPDPYAFWHSSQIGENGLNIANFSDKEVDQLLEDARLSLNKEERTEKYKQFQNIIAEEVPAIFMYSPIYTYAQSNTIKNFEVYNILYPSDRFANISDWYIKTGKKLVW